MLLRRVILTGVAVAMVAAPVAAAAPSPVIVTVTTAKWQPGTGAFKGTQIATIIGDPSKSGAYYSYLIKMPDGLRVPPHFHGMRENVNVISGTLMVGLGDTMDVTKMTALPAGAVASMPAGVHHYAMSKGVTVIEISGIGPDTLTPVHK
jgi:quercetin dioxygenase-like cupin family protein